jgi:hypothetical protein
MDISNNVIVTGYTNRAGQLEDYATVKYDQAGNELWVKKYNGPGNALDKAYDIATDASGNVFVTGESWHGSGFSTVDYCTVKYNYNGEQQWVQRYDGSAFSSRDIAYSVSTDFLGNVYVTGTSYESNFMGNAYTTLKYNNAGSMLWKIHYDAYDGDRAYCVITDTLGNIYVTGESWGEGTNSDYVTVKYSQLIGLTTISLEVPNCYKLFQNYPNPFNPETKIRFSIANKSYVKLRIFDVLGREQVDLVNKELTSSEYEVRFDGSTYPSGVYFYRLEADGNLIDTKKLVLLK